MGAGQSDLSAYSKTKYATHDGYATAALEMMRDLDAPTMAQGLVDLVVDFQNGDRREDIAVLVVKVPTTA